MSSRHTRTISLAHPPSRRALPDCESSRRTSSRSTPSLRRAEIHDLSKDFADLLIGTHVFVMEIFRRVRNHYRTGQLLPNPKHLPRWTRFRAALRRFSGSLLSSSSRFGGLDGTVHSRAHSTKHGELLCAIPRRRPTLSRDAGKVTNIKGTNPNNFHSRPSAMWSKSSFPLNLPAMLLPNCATTILSFNAGTFGSSENKIAIVEMNIPQANNMKP